LVTEYLIRIPSNTFCLDKPQPVSFLSNWYLISMPFRRTRRRRRRRRPRGGKALRAVRNLSKFVDRELHVHDFVLDTDATSVTQVSYLTGIAVGDTLITRQATQVTLRSLRISLFFFVGNQEATTRVSLIMDRQTNGVLPVAADIYERVTNPQQVLTSSFNIINKKRFKVLWDRKFNTNGVDRPSYTTGKRLRLAQRTLYSGNGLNVIDSLSGGLFFVMTSNTVGGANSPHVNGDFRVMFAP